MGIPTVYRLYKEKTAFYLDQTMHSLLTSLTDNERSLVQFVLMLSDVDKERRALQFEKITHLFNEQIQNGLITVIAIPHRYYFQIHNLPRTLGDSQKRMYWRSKQSLDYCFLWEYAQATCDYYLQIEDDVIAEKDYLNHILKDITLFNSKPMSSKGLHKTEASTKSDEKKNLALDKKWVVAEYYPMGFIGRLIPSQFLPMLSTCIKAVYNEYPIDLMYQRFAFFIGKETIARKSLFTHIGKQSSSAGT